MARLQTLSPRSAARAIALARALGCLLVLTVAGGATATAKQHSGAPPRISWSARGGKAGSGAIVAKGRVIPAPAEGQVAIQLNRQGGWRRLAAGSLHRGRFVVRTRSREGLLAAHLRVVLFVGGRRVAVSAVRTVHFRRGATIPPAGPPAPGSGGGSGSTPLPPAAEDPLSAASLMKTITTYSSRPDHLSGTAAGAVALDEFSSALAASGLRLGEQAFAYPRFIPTDVALTAGATAVPRAALAPFLYSGTTAAAGVTAPLFDGGSGSFDKTQIKDKIVVVSIAYEHNSKAVGINPAIEAAVEGEAAGLVDVTQTVGDYPKWEDTNARDGTGPLPVVMVGKRSGAAVVAAAKAGETGTLTLAADTAGTSCERDVSGELEGADPSRRVVIGTPATSFTPSATEHGSGVAITLGLARHYAALPKEQRPETLVFMALGGHEIGWLGLQALLASPQGGWFKEADAYVHLGSALGAPIASEEPDGSIATIPTPDPTGRLHDSENPLLETSIVEDFAAAGVPTPETPPFVASGGEQTNAYAAGIPTVSFSGASLFFHTAGDLPGTVDQAILAKDADAFRRSIDRITSFPAGLLKADNAHAAELGAKINAAARAPYNPTLGAGGSLGSGGIGGPAATPVSHCP